MKVVIRAPLLSISGYGQHSRQVFEALRSNPDFEISTQIVQWGNTSWFLNPEFENGIVGDIMKRSSDAQGGFDVSFQVQLPDEWSNTLAKINVGITAAVETDVCNPAWIEACNRMNAIIVPSQFTKQVLQNTGEVKSPIYVVPEWFISEIEDDQDELDIQTKTDFNFLIVSQLTAVDSQIDRKNITNTIKWICETFKDDKRVGIVLKTNSGRGTAIDRHATIVGIQSAISQIRKISNVPIYLIHGNMSNQEISALYKSKKIRALVSLTRGEGFGLPLLEAAAAGLPVISTDWSAHTEFLNLGKWIKIEHDLISIPEERCDGRIFMKDSKWANPREEEFKRKIKKFRESSIVPKEWAIDLQKECRKNYSRDSIMKKYEEVIKEITKNG